MGFKTRSVLLVLRHLALSVLLCCLVRPEDLQRESTSSIFQFQPVSLSLSEQLLQLSEQLLQLQHRLQLFSSQQLLIFRLLPVLFLPPLLFKCGLALLLLQFLLVFSSLPQLLFVCQFRLTFS